MTTRNDMLSNVFDSPIHMQFRSSTGATVDVGDNRLCLTQAQEDILRNAINNALIQILWADEIAAICDWFDTANSSEDLFALLDAVDAIEDETGPTACLVSLQSTIIFMMDDQ